MTPEFYDVVFQGLPFWIVGLVVLVAIILAPIFDFFEKKLKK